jgi:DNA repair protein RecO (recombination protein O)
VPFRDRTYRTEAIVLRRKDIGEADRVLTLFTPGRGKIRAIAKGIRKPRSRKAGHLELFTRAKLLLAVGRDLDHVTQAELIEAYRPLREDLLRSAYAAYMVELLDRFTPDEEENEALYDLLSKGLEWSSGAGEGTAGQAGALSLAARYFELHLLSMAGYQPQLQRCIICRRELEPEDQFFSPGEGGVICPRCAAAAAKAPAGSTPQRVGLAPLSLNALKVLRFIQASPYGKVAALSVSARTQAEVEYLLARYITILLERQLKSVEFLKLIRREEAQTPTLA